MGRAKNGHQETGNLACASTGNFRGIRRRGVEQTEVGEERRGNDEKKGTLSLRPPFLSHIIQYPVKWRRDTSGDEPLSNGQPHRRADAHK